MLEAVYNSRAIFVSDIKSVVQGKVVPNILRYITYPDAAFSTISSKKDNNSASISSLFRVITQIGLSGISRYLPLSDKYLLPSPLVIILSTLDLSESE